ncbi:uncharacterized protein LOC131616966 [Vicia villosa]|uniref:uncharacterized protein LOC131616965 n=1 Tax=Vicia villosa TaxID=3911 RepID=UPI00273C40E6|nr:uncharacterized protein LOC131616965 [Vicia villosa]XP_058744362.1 uncharacterized protein LOC131616966 [Vicia villosa]
MSQHSSNRTRQKRKHIPAAQIILRRRIIREHRTTTEQGTIGKDNLTSRPYYPTRFQQKRSMDQQKQHGGQRTWRSKPKRSFTPLYMPLSQALQRLLSQNLVTLLPPYSAPVNPVPGYKHHARCAYHSDSPGHDTEDCGPLKHKIQDLIEEGLVEFEDPHKSNAIGG